MSTGRRSPAARELDTMITASRVFAGITAESIAQVDPGITLPQLRVLVLASRLQPLNASAVAAALDVHLSTASRICDRLVQAGLLHRRDRPDDRRQLELTLTAAGGRVLDDITAHRRRVFTKILRRIEPSERSMLTQALNGFIEAAEGYGLHQSLTP